MQDGKAAGASTNIGFLESTIEHHDAALKMARTFLGASPKSRLSSATELAQKIIDAQSKEIVKMRAMISEAKAAGLR